MKHSLLKCAGDTELVITVSTLEDGATIQKGCGTAEKRAKRNCVKFSKDKCPVLALEWTSLSQGPGQRPA